MFMERCRRKKNDQKLLLFMNHRKILCLKVFCASWLKSYKISSVNHYNRIKQEENKLQKKNQQGVSTTTGIATNENNEENKYWGGD